MPTGEGKLYLATVEDLASRRIIGFGLSEHHDAELATAAIKMAVAVRGVDVAGTIFHTDRGSEYTAELFAAAVLEVSDHPIDGAHRVVSRQRRGRVVLLDAGVGAVPHDAVGHQAVGPPRGRRGSSTGTTGSAGTAPARCKPPVAYEAMLIARAAETGTEEEAA